MLGAIRFPAFICGDGMMAVAEVTMLVPMHAAEPRGPDLHPVP